MTDTRPQQSPRPEPKPWPLKWIALAIAAYLVLQVLYIALREEETPPPEAPASENMEPTGGTATPPE